MLRKMYLVSPEHLSAGKPLLSPPAPATQATQPKAAMHKHRARTKTPKRGRQEKQHPYKWIKIKRNMEEADIVRKSLIQKIDDFLQNIQPTITITYAGQTMPSPETQTHGQVLCQRPGHCITLFTRANTRT
jgi:hypothetical protein